MRLVCLDMAGTTVRDDGTVERAFLTAMEALAPPGDDAWLAGALEHVRATMGQSKITVFRSLFDDEGRAQEANRRFEAAYDDAVSRGEVAPIPGAEGAMADLRAAGRLVCLTTGFSPATRDGIVAALGWGSRVDLVLSPADAGRGRPYPDMLLTALIRLGVDDVREVAVAGDTASDLLAGWRAGASVVAGVLTGAHTREQLEAAPHTHVLASVADLPAVVADA
ncbi:MAG: phosphonatase-like hydrolase [Acidimicrobiales bacterium]|nr:phosphonatase-like hydrolase [Acidimicrobiales bacterium]